MTVRLDIPSENAGPQSVAERVADDLKQQITSGLYAPGDRLPGERQLSESLNVSRVSARGPSKIEGSRPRIGRPGWRHPCYCQGTTTRCSAG